MIKQYILDKYHKIDLLEVAQLNSTFYIASVDVTIIKDIFTISPAEYTMNTYRSESVFGNEDEYVIDNLKAKRMEGYQRLKENEDKTNKIMNYIENPEDDYRVFPNSIIFATQTTDISLLSEEQLENFFEREEDIKYQIISYMDDKDKYMLIPKLLCEEAYEETDDSDSEYKKIFVVDGNHRMLGIKKYIDKHNADKKIQIAASFLLDRDKVDEVEIFKTVNYTVKPVDKSYYYQVVGEFEVGQAEHIYLHYVTRYFNELDTSPYYHRFKMLGKSQKESNRKQTLSQSFFVEQLYNWLFVDKGKLSVSRLAKSNYPKRIPVLRYFFVNDKESIALKILASYFDSAREQYNKRYPASGQESSFDQDDKTSWGNHNSNIFLRTLGLGALIELFPLIYLEYLDDNNLLDIQYKITETKFEKYFSKLFHNDNDILSIYEDKYRGASSQGLVKKFTLEMIKLIYKDENYACSLENDYLHWYNENVAVKNI